MLIKQETIEAVRSIPISQVVLGEGGELKKIGREYQSLCVWHNDSNPSLTINDEKGLCFCFACGGGSDAIDYVKQLHNLSFAEAIEHIANKHNVEIRYDETNHEEAVKKIKQKRLEHEHLISEQEKYTANLRDPRATRVLAFLKSRNISDESIEHFGIGYSNSGHFSDRVTIPIFDHRNQLVGFSGRRTRDTGDNIDPQKYKNSSSSLLFDKSKIVFNEYNAIRAARTSGSIIFVEGHFDVITLWQHGIHNVVALQGTAAPLPSTIERLKKSVDKFTLCFDSDAGGLKAIEHFMKTCSRYVLEGSIGVNIASMPDGLDPDQCIRDGLDMRDIIASSISWFDWQIDQWLLSADKSDTASFSKIEKMVREFVESIRSPALRQYYIDKVSTRLVDDKKSAAKIAKDWILSSSKIKVEKNWSKPQDEWTRRLVEKRVIRMYIHFPAKRTLCRPLMDRLHHPPYAWLWQRISELEMFSQNTVDRHMIMAVLCCCEPELTQALRPVVSPSIRLSDSDAILEHAKIVLSTSQVHQENDFEFDDALDLSAPCF